MWTVSFKKCLSLALLACLPCLLAGCVDLTLRSAWKDREITFDGKNSEWLNSLVKEKNVAFGAFNDDENLELCFSITDKVTKAQLMGLFKQDFYIWLATEDGILAKKRRGFGLMFSNDSAFMDEEMLVKTRYLRVHAFQVIADEMMSHLNIRVLRGYYPVATLQEARGIDAGIWMFKDGRQLVYRIKIPLARSDEHPYAVGAAAGAPVYVGLETSPVDMPMLEKQLNSEERGDIKDPAGREGTMMLGDMRRSITAAEIRNYENQATIEHFQPVRVWCKVILARKPL